MRRSILRSNAPGSTFSGALAFAAGMFLARRMVGADPNVARRRGAPRQRRPRPAHCHQDWRRGRGARRSVQRHALSEQYDGRSFSQAPAQESPEGTATLADCDDCVLRPELEPGDEDHRWHRAVRECTGGRVADWKVNRGDIRGDPGIAREILEFIEKHRVLSVAMTDAIIGCPHQEGMDYEGEWCPVCEFWHGRDRFTGERVN